MAFPVREMTHLHTSAPRFDFRRIIVLDSRSVDIRIIYTPRGLHDFSIAYVFFFAPSDRSPRTRRII